MRVNIQNINMLRKLCNLIEKAKTNGKMGKDLNRHFPKEDV